MPDDQSSVSSHRKTACLRCRTSRQRCDRQLPCSRCQSQHVQCHYPSTSRRGRRPGSTNKPDTVEKIVSRIQESENRDQIIAAILQLADVSTHPHTPSTGTTAVPPIIEHDEPIPYRSQAGDKGPANISIAQEPLASPIGVLANVVESADCYDSESSAGTAPLLSQSFFFETRRKKILPEVCERLKEYFSPRKRSQSDWEVLALQNGESTLKLDPTLCDPIAARFIDENDAIRFFELFFNYRNPFVGLLDPLLHTPKRVQSTSFTLFSVICALGCALSDRQRDRLLHPTLLAIARGNINWSMAVSVKSIETIQSIIIYQYWAPAYRYQTEDPYWLHINYAAQLAREIGLNRPPADKLSSTLGHDLDERLSRNHERTWLFMFTTDRSLGFLHGHVLGLSSREIPQSLYDWSLRSTSSAHDSTLSGIVEFRRCLLTAFEVRKHRDATLADILDWQSSAVAELEQARNEFCDMDSSTPSPFISILSFHANHTLLVIVAQTLQDLKNINADMASDVCIVIAKKIFSVSEAVLDLLLGNTMIEELMIGLHNNQFIMICHAITELINVFRYVNLLSTDAARVISEVCSVTESLDKIAQKLPDSSMACLYASLSRSCAEQLDKVAKDKGRGNEDNQAINCDFSADAWIEFGNAFFDPSVLNNDFFDV